MFSRSHGKPSGFAKEKEKDRSQEAHQLSALAELGLIESKKARSGGGGAWGTDFNRPNYSSSRAARSFTGVTYPEKSKWISSGAGRLGQTLGLRRTVTYCWSSGWALGLSAPLLAERLTLLCPNNQIIRLLPGPFALHRTAPRPRSARPSRVRATGLPLSG